MPDVAHCRLSRLDDAAQVGQNHKIGFCLFDDRRYRSLPTSPSAPQFPTDAGCKSGGPDATSFEMGVSVGYSDTYRW